MPSKKLFLLDALALIYRAHFALSKNPRVNSKGLNTGAILGFTNTLWDIIKREKPSHIGVAFDTHAPTFRHEAFAEYKAQREEQPEEIQVAIPIVKKLVRAFNIPVLELDGYEADDVIGTLAKKFVKHDFEVFMMTPDKDYGQLVEDHIFLYKPAYMGNSIEIMGIPEVLKKWGISRVDQVIDMLAMQGDSVDNIPGIPSIGPKTAAKLLEKYDTLEGLLDHVDELKGKQQEKVRDNAEQARLSKELATINIEVPIEVDEEALCYTGFDEKALKEIFEELEFRTVAKRILGEEIKTEGPAKDGGQMSLFGTLPKKNEEAPQAQAIPEKKDIHSTEHHYHCIETEEQLEDLVHYLQLQEEFCFDTETSSLNAHEAELVGIAFSYLPGEAYYLPLPAEREQTQKLLQILQPALANENIVKIGQNLKYDITVLKNYGIEVKGKLFDTMLAHYLIEPDMRHNMDVLAETYLHYQPVSIESLIGKKGKKQGNMRDVEVGLITEYAGEDADITLQLKHALAPQLGTNEKGLLGLFNKVETPLIQVLSDMEINGVKVDTEALAQFSAELQTLIGELEKTIYEEAGESFNINSPKQLGEILFDKFHNLLVIFRLHYQIEHILCKELIGESNGEVDFHTGHGCSVVTAMFPLATL